MQTVILFGFLMLAAILAVIFAIAWLMNGQTRAVKRTAESGRALRPVVLPMLQAAPRGLLAIEIASATGQAEDVVRSCLGQLAFEGLAHEVLEADEQGRVVTRFFGGRKQAPTPQRPPQQHASRDSEPPHEPPEQGLPERWLAVRRDIVMSNANDLDCVQDIMHPFYVCKQCKQSSTSVAMLQGSILADAATLPPALEQLSKRPEDFGIARKTTCDCRGKATLRRIVLCRTNPTRGNDLHITIDSHRRGTPQVSFLFPDGRYEHLGADGFQRVFGG